jgi:hypothetical protein
VTVKSWYVEGECSRVGRPLPSAAVGLLLAAERMSRPGIVVLPSPRNAPALDGGIALKANQNLVGDGPLVVELDMDAHQRRHRACGPCTGGVTVGFAAGAHALEDRW